MKLLLGLPLIYLIGMGLTQAYCENHIREPKPFTLTLICTGDNPTRAGFWPIWWPIHLAYLAGGGSNIAEACKGLEP